MLKVKDFSTIQAETEGMVIISAGAFSMGSGTDGGVFEKPLHQVYLDSFYIDAAPVTNEQFAAFAKSTNYTTTAENSIRNLRKANLEENEEANEQAVRTWQDFALPGRELHPVLMVSWFDAAAYAKWAGKRLPTEAEWEKAARGNLNGKHFPWGNDKPKDRETNWNQVQTSLTLPPPTTAVKSFPPNNYGIYDAAGNVWEWCADWYADDYYAKSPLSNPAGPEQGTYKVRRGASWNVREDFRLRCANRGAMPPERFWSNIGFRCAI